MKNNKIKRTFYPGDEWLYFRVYTGVKSADKILTEAVYSIFKKSRKEKLARKCFFIRYNDPDYHIRLRFLIEEKENIGKVVGLCHEKLRKYCTQGFIHRIEIGTYEREVERYGNRFIETSESLFSLDSLSIIDLLRAIQFKDENYRWMGALKLIDSFFDAMNCNLADKYKYMISMNDSFKKEFGFNEYNSKQLNQLFRTRKKQVESALGTSDSDIVLMDINKIITKRTQSIKKELEAIELPDYSVSSYIHMTMNRLFRSKNRLYELLIYDFMVRYYKSELAKIKYNK